MAYEPHFQKCPYRTANNNCVNKKVSGKKCGYKRVDLCPMYNEWVLEQKMDSDCVETSQELNLKESDNE